MKFIGSFPSDTTLADITSVIAGTGLSGGGTTGAVTLNVEASQTQITGLGTISEGIWEANAISSEFLDADTAHLTTTQTFTGKKTFQDTTIFDGNRSVTPGDGVMIHVDAADITDSNTSASGTAARYAHVNIESPRLLATNASVTTSDAATLYIKGPPVAATNQTITRARSLWVDSGDVKFDGALLVDGTITGTLGTATQGTIDHDSLANFVANEHIDWTGSSAGTIHSSNIPTLNQNTSGSSGSCTGNAATVTTASDDTANSNHGVLFTGSSPGDSTVLQDGGLLYNPHTNILFATLGTVSQPNVTGVGTIGTGVWQGTAIASAYLDADTAHYSATRQVTHHMITDDIDSDVVYISLGEIDIENTSGTAKHLPLIAPTAGKLLKIFLRTSVDHSAETFTWKLYTRNVSSGTGGAPSVIGAQSGAGPTNKTMVTYDFTTGLDSGVGSETNAIAAGDKVQISIEAGDGATANGNYFITCMWEWDLS